MTFKLKILLAVTGLLVGGLLLFSHGSDTHDTPGKNTLGSSRKQSVTSTATPSKSIATPFAEPLNSEPETDRQSPPSPNSAEEPQDISSGNISAAQANDNQPQPMQLVNAYMTAWSGDNRSEVDALWREISQCPDCLQRIKELLISQAVPQGMLLELTYKVIELGDETMLPIFDYLLQPDVELNTRIILTQQMIKDGRAMYVKKLFDILQQADFDGYEDYAAKHVWMISKLTNPEGIAAIFDVISQRSRPSERFAAHVRNVFNNTLLGTKQQKEMTDAMVHYYLSASDVEQEKLWGVMSLHSESLVALSVDAYQNGSMDQFKKYSQTLASVNSVGAVEGVLELAASVNYPQDYFTAMISTLTQRYHNLETLRKMEDYLRDPGLDSRTRIVAADGLLAVKESEQARYILEKALQSTSYEDADIVAYISARL